MLNINPIKIGNCKDNQKTRYRFESSNYSFYSSNYASGGYPTTEYVTNRSLNNTQYKALAANGLTDLREIKNKYK